MADRTIILHYHLFKNAGTSVDKILKDNFPGRWVTAEFPSKGGNNTPLVAEWIRDNPEAVAFSSHTMMGPIPEIEGVRVISLMLLRDPIARLRSAYRFERDQNAETLGAVLAKHTSFEGYVRVRLALPNDRQCRNFQTQRLAQLVPGDGPELERAKAALGRLSVVGRVEAFDETMARLARAIERPFPHFMWGDTRANASREARGTEEAMNDALAALLAEENADDRALLDHAAAQIETTC